MGPPATEAVLGITRDGLFHYPAVGPILGTPSATATVNPDPVVLPPMTDTAHRWR